MRRFVSGTTDQYIYFVAVDSTDLKTRETGLTSFTVYRARNGAAAAAYTTPTVAEVSAANMPGVYSLLLDEDMTIGTGNDSEEVVLHITQASMAPVTLVYELYREKITQGNTLAVDSGGRGEADVQEWNGSPDVPNGMFVGGTADSGSTTTVVDAARTEADTDYWKGSIILFTNGTLMGQSRLITGFDPATDTITFAPATTQAVATHTYAIIPGTPSAAEIADAVWDEDATAHQTQGTFGQAIGDPGADTDTIHGILNAAWNGSAFAANLTEIAGSSSARRAAFKTGTADSGTTTTMVDAALTEANTDHWKGSIIVFSSGTIEGEARLITGFDPATDTITFTPAVDAAVSTQTYIIMPRPVMTELIADAVWDEAQADHVTAGSFGVTASEIADILVDTAEIGAAGAGLTALASQASVNTIDDFLDTEVAAILAAVDTEVAAIKAKTDNLPAAPAATGDIPSAATIADAVWDEAIAGHATAGSTGEQLSTAGAAGDPWATALPGAYGAGTAGKIVGDNLDATVSSRASQTSVDTVDDFLDTEIAAIKAKTDNLPAAPAATGDIPTAEAIADAVWDEVLTGATHNVTNSAGRRLRQIDAVSLADGTAQAGASNSITLAAGASSTNEIYDGNLIVITEGTGVGQTRTIVEYNGTTKVAIVGRVWEVNPDATSVYEIIAATQADIAHHGLAQAGTATTITLASTASATDDVYVGNHIYLSTSSGTGQTRLITDYDGTTKVATVSPAWAVNPGATSVYKIFPVGRSIVETLSTQAKADVNAEVDTAIADASLLTEANLATGIADLPTNTELATALDAIPTAAENAAGLLDLASGVETNLTVREALRLVASVLFGKVSGADTATVTFRDTGDSKDRVIAITDNNGNRTTVTLDKT